MPNEYKGGYVRQTKVDRPDDGTDTEHVGAGGTGLSRAKFDQGAAAPRKPEKVLAQVDTTGVGITQEASLKRAHASWS